MILHKFYGGDFVEKCRKISYSLKIISKFWKKSARYHGKRHFVTGWLSFAGKFFTMMSSKKKGGRYTESKKENWRHEKLSTKIQTKPLKKPLQQRLYFRA